MSLRPQRDDELPSMNPFSGDFTLFPGDSDEEIPEVKSVMADRHDAQILSNLRMTLATKYTTYYRYQSVTEWNNLFDPASKQSKIIQAVFGLTQTNLENAKIEILSQEIVRLHDKVNAYKTISKLAMNDGLYASMQIAANDPEDRKTKAPIHWTTVFNEAMVGCHAEWQPTIADVETEEQRYARQRRQFEKQQAVVKDRERFEKQQRHDLNKKFNEEVLDCAESELPELIRRERARRLRQDKVEFEIMKAKVRATAEGKGKMAEAQGESAYRSEAESETTVTEPKKKKKTDSKKPDRESKADSKQAKQDRSHQKPSLADQRPNYEPAKAGGLDTVLKNFPFPPGSQAKAGATTTNTGHPYGQPGRPAQPISHQSLPKHRKPKPSPGTLAEDWFDEDKKGGRKK